MGLEEKAVVLRTMPTLATIKLSRRWGTRFRAAPRYAVFWALLWLKRLQLMRARRLR